MHEEGFMKREKRKRGKKKIENERRDQGKMAVKRVKYVGTKKDKTFP